MEQVRILIAIGLCLLVFLAWDIFFTEKKPVKTPEKITAPKEDTIASSEIPKQEEIILNKKAEYSDKAETAYKPIRTIEVETPFYTAKLSEKGALFKSFLLKKYREKVDLDSPPLEMIDKQVAGTVLLDFEKTGVSNINSSQFAANVSEDRITVKDKPQTIVFRNTSSKGITIDKSFTFLPDSYIIDVFVTVTNSLGTPFQDSLIISLLNSMPSEKAASGFTGPSALLNDKLENIEIKKIKDKNNFFGKINWIAFQNTYFISSIIPQNPVEAGFHLDILDAKFISSRYIQPIDTFNPGAGRQYKFKLYFGPKDTSLLKSFHNGLEKAADFGMFDFLAKPCLWLLKTLYGIIPNYGVDIIILTIIIKLLLWPLGSKSYKSMNEMKRIQPLMAEIREKYKNDKKKMNEEVMGLYRTYKVNPMGGCLPLLLQIPVFFALYRMLYEAIELRHAPFIGWINDLSAPDRLFRFGFSIPFMQAPYGIPVLTIVMGATMFIQQKMSPPAGDPTQAKMMMLMPIVFTFIFINFSSGLVLYWLVNNILSIAQQYYIQKKYA